MTCTVHTIRGPNQSGKTTLALGALESLHQKGIPVAYVLPTYDLARAAIKRTNVPCLPWAAAIACPDPSWRAVVVEDIEHVPQAQIDAGIEALRSSLATNGYPTQLLLIETSQFRPANRTQTEIRMSVIDEIAAERRRQIEIEGRTPEHDDTHPQGEMAAAAGSYAIAASEMFAEAEIGEPPFTWPWSREWWKPKTPRRDLIRAAALLVAEVERMDRMTPNDPAQGRPE